MITPTFVFTLLLLGYSQALTIKGQPEQPPKKPFVMTIDPGFKVTGAKLGDSNLTECADPSQAAKAVTPCYKQTIESTVKVIIAEQSLWQKAEFMVGTVVKATATMSQLAQGHVDAVVPPSTGANAVQKGKLEKSDLSLTFVPTAMKLVPNPATGDGPAVGESEHKVKGTGQEQAQTQPETISVTETCPVAATPENSCVSIVNAKYPVFVLAEMSSTPQVLTLTGAGDKEFKTTFFQGSAAAWLSHSAALILANLAIVYFAY